ncbi:MAG TPA: asparaginase [Candidatus Ornithospirochaeta avicola]|uniref:Asparaginase n=1 Tax=Candidatus Ornithospirochaeta avicola TaxID=2840896 RepID=A0A9D1PUQ8_9SPIO|nr:asparaginase [Candidatus Ornithospirochaeta avicola]
MADLRIITTGGTFDKLYDAIKGDLTFRESQLPRILINSRLGIECRLEGPLAKDSLYMSDEDRKNILRYVEASVEKRIVVIHGTDTMCETAKVVAAGDIKDKTVVFTGAMIPYSLENSDAEFNLGFAVSSALLLKSGVYIAMNGRIFDYDNVRKNREKGIFEEIM